MLLAHDARGDQPVAEGGCQLFDGPCDGGGVRASADDLVHETLLPVNRRAGLIRGTRRLECKLTSRYTFAGISWRMPKDAQATRRRILDAAYELFYRKGSAASGSTRSPPRRASPSARSTIISRARTTCWRRCSNCTANWRWRVSGNTRTAIRAARPRSSMFCSRNSPDGRQSLPGPGPGSHASPWNSPTCPATPRAQSPIATRRPWKAGGQASSKGPAVLSLRTGARGGAPDGGGDGADPHSRRSRVR